ncbi:MAG: redoxin domain-containing protein [Chloroflexota bacterium]
MPSRERSAVIIILTACLIGLVACIPEPEPTSTPAAVSQAPSPTKEMRPTSTPTEEATANPQPPQEGNPAFDFTLQTLEGEEVSLSDFRGQAVMLNFWASWCGPCRIEIPHMIELYKETHDQDFEIVAVNLRENTDRVEDFVQRFDIPFPVLLDEKGRIGAAYHVQGIPTSIFIDEEGVIRHVHVGALTEDALQHYVDDLLP